MLDFTPSVEILKILLSLERNQLIGTMEFKRGDLRSICVLGQETSTNEDRLALSGENRRPAVSLCARSGDQHEQGIIDKGGALPPSYSINPLLL